MPSDCSAKQASALSPQGLLEISIQGATRQRNNEEKGASYVFSGRLQRGLALHEKNATRVILQWLHHGAYQALRIHQPPQGTASVRLDLWQLSDFGKAAVLGRDGTVNILEGKGLRSRHLATRTPSFWAHPRIATPENPLCPLAGPSNPDPLTLA